MVTNTQEVLLTATFNRAGYCTAAYVGRPPWVGGARVRLYRAPAAYANYLHHLDKLQSWELRTFLRPTYRVPVRKRTLSPGVGTRACLQFMPVRGGRTR